MVIVHERSEWLFTLGMSSHSLRGWCSQQCSQAPPTRRWLGKALLTFMQWNTRMRVWPVRFHSIVMAKVFSQLLVSLHTDFSQTLLDDPELWDFTLDLMDQPPQSATTNPCNSDPGSDYRMSTRSKTPQRPAYLRTTVLPQGNEGFAQHRSHQCVPKFSGTGTLPWRCLNGMA